MVKIELRGRMQRGRPKKIFRDVGREDMQTVVVRREDSEDKKELKKMNCCGTSYKYLGKKRIRRS